MTLLLTHGGLLTRLVTGSFHSYGVEARVWMEIFSGLLLVILVNCDGYLRFGFSTERLRSMYIPSSSIKIVLSATKGEKKLCMLAPITWLVIVTLGLVMHYLSKSAYVIL